MEMNNNRVGRGNRPPSERSEAKPEVDVGAVERDMFVKTARLGPRRAAIAIRASPGQNEDGSDGSRLFTRLSGKPVEGRQRHIECQPDGVDGLSIGTNRHRRDRADLLIAPK
jgi:hypothetical protein